MLQGGLAEAHRLASDARAILASKYQDAMIVVALTGLVVWAFLLVVFFGSLSSVFRTALEAVLVDTALTLALVALPLVLVRRSYRARIGEQVRWMERLQRGMSPYAAREGVSVFDLLVEASQQVPAWLSIRRGDRYNRHPFLSTAAFIAGSSVVYLVVVVLTVPNTSGVGYLLLMLGAFAAILLGSLYQITAMDRQEKHEVLERWRRRMEESRRSMEEILGGL